MVRSLLIAALVASGLAGCGMKPDAPAAPSSTADAGSLRSVQDSQKPEITAARISKDVVGKVVTVPEASSSLPDDKWTFESDEYRKIDILEKRTTGDGLDLTVFMLTRSRPGEGDIQVSGQLKLHYEWKGKQWVLQGIENVSFRYSLGVST